MQQKISLLMRGVNIMLDMAIKGGLVMSWIARNSNKHLFIYSKEPIKREFYWEPQVCENSGIETDMIRLPSDADEKLIGRHIIWEDEPVEI